MSRSEVAAELGSSGRHDPHVRELQDARLEEMGSDARADPPRVRPSAPAASLRRFRRELGLRGSIEAVGQLPRFVAGSPEFGCRPPPLRIGCVERVASAAHCAANACRRPGAAPVSFTSSAMSASSCFAQCGGEPAQLVFVDGSARCPFCLDASSTGRERRARSASPACKVVVRQVDLCERALDLGPRIVGPAPFEQHLQARSTWVTPCNIAPSVSPASSSPVTMSASAVSTRRAGARSWPRSPNGPNTQPLTPRRSMRSSSSLASA